jgi:hypothetical protein
MMMEKEQNESALLILGLEVYLAIQAVDDFVRFLVDWITERTRCFSV